ncbi:putative bifunctional diguanylate cyclase/phosphodiesterase [Mycolicibacterium tusciae]|uniref:putative bifunctional diguanylate cyclase/phosphodiesterase n=1 Tax=Mycolicibacterium tusciae TaxID=75922 RepID=UPI00024A2A63|nr:EAL domain-containing protein [Mycolicibacterium tusciae]
MVPNARRPLVYLAAFVAALAVINAMGLWGHSAAHRGEAALQLAAGLGAVACGIVVARRVSGSARWWRLAYVAAIVCWLVGQVLWWTDSAGVAPLAASVAYLGAPAFAVGSVALLVRSGEVTGQTEGVLRAPFVVNVLDGVVAGMSFLILAAMGGFNTGSTASLPRSGVTAVELGFVLAEVLLVAAVVVIAMIYDPSSPSRTNYLFMAGGLVTMAAADRVVSYLRSTDLDNGDLWGGIGFILGPLMIAFAMLEPSPRNEARANRGGDLARLILPYCGFLGIALLFAFHVLMGRPLDPFAIVAAVVMVFLVAVRQVVAMRAQQMLTQRLYRAQHRLAYQLHHDALTGLPNRILFTQRLDEAMRDGGFVLIFIDLDDFKEVNDRFGHAGGDELLVSIGQRLKRCVRDTDTLARIGGDEFAILIDGEPEQLEVAAERLRVALRDPFALHGSSVRVKASMGLVRPGTDGVAQTSDDLLRQADISMYAGKRVGKDTAVVYQPSSGLAIDFPTALREAAGGAPPGFRLVYQVVVQLPDGKPVAVEALARWTAPNGVEMSPETFVSVAEAAGLGADLDALVLDLACRDIRKAGLDVDIHVNIGAGRLGNPGFEQQVHGALTRYHLPPSRLVVEITETLPIVDVAHAAAQINRLNALGVKVALDDFGAGFNSLLYLHALPVQIVKLDRGLATADPARDLTLYRSVIGLCSELGLTVIAEGIESVAQSDAVYRAGGRLAQGHLFGRPVPISELRLTPADPLAIPRALT